MANAITNNAQTSKQLHVVMFPWFAFGHFTPFLHLSNELAQRGHKVSYLLPNKASIKLQHQNLHPDLITFYPLTLPPVDGLPQGAETTSDVLLPSETLLAKALDLTRDQVQALVSSLAPDFVFYDIAHWIPELASILGVKSVFYSALTASIYCSPTKTHIMDTSPKDEFLDHEFGMGVTFRERMEIAMKSPDAVAIRTCAEVEGEIVEHTKKTWGKPVLLTGPILPEAEDGSRLDPKWDEWLNTFGGNSQVIFCVLGTQVVLDKGQFHELVLGFEATGLPFLAVLQPPLGCTTIEEALPKGFKERVKDKGVVYDGWVQQRLILKHPSVGCFFSHCGPGSIWEGLVSESQMVWLPFLMDQIINATRMAEEMKVAVMVERDENDRATKEKVYEAINSVMDEESEIGRMVRENHLKYRDVLTKEGFMSGYIDKFVADLRELKNI